MKKLLILIIPLSLLVGCGTSGLEERQEHDNVTCVYRVHNNFWGTRHTEERVACHAE